MLRAAVPLLWWWEPTGYVVSLGRKGDPYADWSPSEYAVHYFIRFGSGILLENRARPIYWSVCSIREGTAQDETEHGFSSSELTVRSVIQLLQRNRPEALPLGLRETDSFADADAVTEVGFRVHFSSMRRDMVVSLCHLLYHK